MYQVQKMTAQEYADWAETNVLDENQPIFVEDIKSVKIGVVTNGIQKNGNITTYTPKEAMRRLNLYIFPMQIAECNSNELDDIQYCEIRYVKNRDKLVIGNDRGWWVNICTSGGGY